MGIETALAGASLLGSALQASAAEDAEDSQYAANQQAQAEQRRQFDLTRGDFAPYRQAGAWALRQLLGSGFTPPQTADYFDGSAYLQANPDVAAAGMDPLQHWNQYGRNENRQFTYNRAGQALQGSGVGELDRPVTSEDVMQDPGYQFGLQQGQQALDRKIAAMGGRVSGAALKAATRYGTDYATTGYGAAYQRRQDRLNRLQALAGVGQTATGASAAAGQNSANAISGLLTAQGDNAGAAGMAQANIWADAGNQIAAMYGRKQRSSAPYPIDPYSAEGW